MDKKTEALKLALELLDKQWQCEQPWSLEESQDVADIIREALAEQCVCGEPDTPGTHRTDGPCLAEQPSKPLTDERAKELWDQSRCAIPRYLTFKTLVESELGAYRPQGVFGVSTPANANAGKPWVGLTDEERKEIYRQAVYVDGAIRMTEAKLKEKNQ